MPSVRSALPCTSARSTAGWFRRAHVKTQSCYRMRLLLTHRRNLKRKFLDLEKAIRHSLKAFGIRLGGTGRGKFDAAVREAVADDPFTADLMEAMLTARAALWKEYCRPHDLVVKMVAQSDGCTLLRLIASWFREIAQHCAQDC